MLNVCLSLLPSGLTGKFLGVYDPLYELPPPLKCWSAKHLVILANINPVGCREVVDEAKSNKISYMFLHLYELIPIIFGYVGGFWFEFETTSHDRHNVAG